jgi:hypothetical protein
MGLKLKGYDCQVARTIESRYQPAMQPALAGFMFSGIIIASCSICPNIKYKEGSGWVSLETAPGN